MDKNILTARTIISADELCYLPQKYIKEKVHHDLSNAFVRELMNHVVIEECVSYDNPFHLGKEYRASAVVIPVDEYKKMKKKADLLDEYQKINSQIFNI
ncbi:hypothetical protein [Geobacillus phage GR1]|nr:hypothetical protein [Geobacillus phage GR1]